MEASDQELLRAFVRERSEDAFRRMVKRHLNLVFATARRILGDPQLAEEVAQGVFLLLARKAGEIGNQQPLAGWLYHTARHHALNASRAEGRRRQREQTAAAMQTNETTPEPEWIAAELEGALEELPAEDRDALVLRFLDNRQLREVGVELGISEEAARKRVSRALDKLRGIFGKRGVALSTGLLATALSGQAGAAAPAGLGATIIASALTGLTAASATAITATQTTTTLMNWFNLKTTAAILGAAAVTGTTTYLVQEREAERLRADYQTLNDTHAKLANDQQEATGIIQLRDLQIAQLQKDVADIPRLRAESDALRRQLAQLRETSVPNNQLAASAGRQPLADPDSERDRRIASLRELGKAVIMHADDNQGLLPANLLIDGPLAPYFDGMLKKDVVSSEILNLGDFEVMPGFVVHQEDLQRDYAVNSQIIVVRERAPRFQEGKFERFYVTATMGVIVKSATAVADLETWENERKPDSKGL